MTVNGRRRLRLVFKLGLLVCLPVTGYLWAMSGISAATVGASVLCVVMALGAEGLASVSETRLSQLRAQAEEEERIHAAEVAARAEKIRQMDRIVETLSNQNHDLRGKLVSLHGEIHRLSEEMDRLRPDDDDAGHPRHGTHHEPDRDRGDAAPLDGSSGGGEVTDISSLRNRR